MSDAPKNTPGDHRHDTATPAPKTDRAALVPDTERHPHDDDGAPAALPAQPISGVVRARFGARIEWLATTATSPDAHCLVHTAKTRRSRDTIATGDRIQLSRQGSDWVVERRLPRRNEVRRIDGFGRIKTIAANVDRIWLVTTHSPLPAQYMLERMLAAIYALGATPIIVWNKIDLADPAKIAALREQRSTFPAARSPSQNELAETLTRELITATNFRGRSNADTERAQQASLRTLMPAQLRKRITAATLGLDVPIVPVSTKLELGLDQVRDLAKNATNLMLGGSGVGKTSLLRALIPGLDSADEASRDDLRVNDLGHSGEGQHTTTTARLHVLQNQAIWIDAPGVRDFTPVVDDTDFLERGFPELTRLAADCRFRDCRHAAEPGCAVRDAVGKTLSPSRFAVWRQLVESLADSLAKTRSR
ncbi:MAG: ribosome small subunit-dependent GTPase A [Thioalkalivibrionaceae bacterium]